ncbi:uncharacterized protein FOMMEDRAFT_18718 [Fomitiporia mediterranea MF3/22]|uniref:uncharacterized protein n=1 Tax=Fomitiporia mediterranea (strain MF3/22) TaxID=694068 RepID=UPI00044090EA|nr:uncharacterized protein FOMMEDRAFT_18718 [Fomitiporia mediterranea MF3/22]EJD05048.1 hypothetical protein FOMMEDRAFT_18718 [Fomitiporia mediterranea MF3/22]
MICTHAQAGPSAHRASTRAYTNSPSCGYANNAIFPFPGPAPTRSQREMYLRALEQEREEILAAAYADKRSNSPTNTYVEPFVPDFDGEDTEDEDESRFDDRGRQHNFRETVRQRQARLEFLRRQDFARRIAHRGLEDAKASAYAIKRLPPPRARPIERVNAATKIQRAYRLHRAVAGLNDLTARVDKAHETFVRGSRENYEEAWRKHAETLHALLRELGERTGVLSAAETSSTSAQNQNQTQIHPRVRSAARAAMDALRAELAQLDRMQVSRHYAPAADAASLSSISSNEEGDYYDDDDDDDDESDDDDYSSYTYTPPSYATSLYVVEEEDEDDVDAFERQPAFEPVKATLHQRARHTPLISTSYSSMPAPVPVKVPGLIRSPVARSPSLPSIPEEVDIEA